MGYKHLLAAVDLTDEAQEVLTRARRLADNHQARLSICTVVRPLTQVYGGLDMMAYSQATVSFEEEAMTQARKQLETLAGANQIDAADVHVTLGAPAASVVDTANAVEADLIVIGSHGKHGLELLLGSTATGVLHRAVCDVLTVRITS